MKDVQVDGVSGLAVDGTPADTVILGLNLFSQTPVHFVISGINRGPNPGFDVFYSGTVSSHSCHVGNTSHGGFTINTRKLNYKVAAETALDIFLHFEETLSRQKFSSQCEYT